MEFTIDCDCIREELHQSPGMFLLRVTNCTLFEIAPYEIDHALDGFEALDSGGFEILDAVIERGVVEVSNATGLMRLCPGARADPALDPRHIAGHSSRRRMQSAFTPGPWAKNR